MIPKLAWNRISLTFRTLDLYSLLQNTEIKVLIFSDMIPRDVYLDTLYGI